MSENDWNCPKCGNRMTIHFAGEDNHINWLECENCGRPEQPDGTITCTNGEVEIVFTEDNT